MRFAVAAGGRLALAAQRGTDAGEQFAGAERFRQVVVGAGVESADFFALGNARRQHDDRHHRPFAHVVDEVDAVAVRQAEIEQHDVRRLGSDALGRLGNSPGAVPLATRVFSRTERLWVRIGAYAAAGEPQITARLLNRVGGEMRPLPVETTAIADIYQVDVPLAGLAASEYSVQFTVAVGGRQASESVIFRVTP